VAEVGGGTGRYVRRLCSHFRTVLVFDISEGMAREAMRKFSSGEGPGTFHYFVADAERVPFRGRSVDCVVFAGVLSQMASPRMAIAEAGRIVKEGGCILGFDKNRSAFRPLFDLIMSLNPSWVGKSNPPDVVLSRSDLRTWFRDAGVPARMWTEVFVPPHVFNLLPPPGAERLLWATNAVGSRLPWLRSQGGVVLFSGKR